MARKRMFTTMKSHRVDEVIHYLENLISRFGKELYLCSSDIELGSSIIVNGDDVTVYIDDCDGDEFNENEVE